MDNIKRKKERKIQKEKKFEHPKSYCKNFEMVVDAPTTEQNKVLPSSPTPLRLKVKVMGGGKDRRQEENDEAFFHLSRMANSIASTYLKSGNEFRTEGGGDVNDDGKKNSNEIDEKKKDESFQEKFAKYVQNVNNIHKCEDELYKERNKRRRLRWFPQNRDDKNDDDEDNSSNVSKENFSHQESSDSPPESEETDDDVETTTITMSFARKVVGKRTAEELRKKRERVENRKKRKERSEMWFQTDYHRIDGRDIDETDENYDDPFIDKKVKYEYGACHFTKIMQRVKQKRKNKKLIAFRKTFLLYQLLHQLLYLKSNVYNYLKPGLYCCFNIITKKQMLKYHYSWTRRFPYTHQDWVMLTYDVRNEEFFLMLPSQPTRQPVNEIRKSKVLDDDNVFLIMNKDENALQSWNHPKPDWELTHIGCFYPPYSQFIVHQCSKYEDTNAGKVIDVKISTPEMHSAFIQQVESKIDRKDFRNLLKYNSVCYSSESKKMVDNSKRFKFREDLHF